MAEYTMHFLEKCCV